MNCKRDAANRMPSLEAKLDHLDETGRLHYFYHCPSSSLPIRDVLGEAGHGRKTEPYIEKRAENYYSACMQPNIRGFLQSREKYLFLVTRCLTRSSEHKNKLCVVGYLVKGDYEERPGGFYAALGDMKLFSFDKAFPLADANFRQRRRILNSKKTDEILRHFRRARNILPECLDEVARLKRCF